MRRAVSVSVVIKIEHKVPLIAHTKVFVSMKQVCRAVSVLHALSSKTHVLWGYTLVPFTALCTHF